VTAELDERLLAGTEPDDAPPILLLEVLLDETTDRVVVLDEQQNSTGPASAHKGRICGGVARASLRGGRASR
jgi:hypothetical protein